MHAPLKKHITKEIGRASGPYNCYIAINFIQISIDKLINILNEVVEPQSIYHFICTFFVSLFPIKFLIIDVVVLTGFFIHGFAQRPFPMSIFSFNYLRAKILNYLR